MEWDTLKGDFIKAVGKHTIYYMISDRSDLTYENLYEAVTPLRMDAMSLAPGELVTETQLGIELDRLELSGNIRLIGFAKRALN